MAWIRDFALRRRGLMSYQFPFTVPVVMYSGSLLVAGTAAMQRDFTQPWLLVVAISLVFAPIVAFIVFGHKPATLATAASVLTGVALLLLCWPSVFLDAAPFLLMFMLGEVFALGSVRHGLLAALLLVVERLDAAPDDGDLGAHPWQGLEELGVEALARCAEAVEIEHLSASPG